MLAGHQNGCFGLRTPDRIYSLWIITVSTRNNRSFSRLEVGEKHLPMGVVSTSVQRIG
jgi:hypothetical protein